MSMGVAGDVVCNSRCKIMLCVMLVCAWAITPRRCLCEGRLLPGLAPAKHLSHVIIRSPWSLLSEHFLSIVLFLRLQSERHFTQNISHKIF